MTDKRLSVLVALYLGGILSANAMAAKMLTIFGVSVTTGAIAIPIVYLTTDLLNELYGEATARSVVWMGFIANAVLVAMSVACATLPASSFGASQDAFDAVFHVTPRVVLASMTAYLTSSLLDVWLFAAIRKVTGKRHFWLRKNGSTAVSQLVDTLLFVVIAFAGNIPLTTIPGVVLGQYIIKIAAAPLGTPLSYTILRFAK